MLANKQNESTIDISRAMQIINKHQVKGAPVNVVPIANELGIEVYRIDTLPAGYSGMIKKEVNGEYAIYVNKAHSVTRRRFTIAHEIAHLVLHQNQIGDGIFDDAMYRSGLSNATEREADTFAADILMPYSLIRIEIKKEGRLNIENLAKIFNVSQQAMSIRIAQNSSLGSLSMAYS